MNPNIHPGQFALPGLEHHAHPGAPFLPKGITFSQHESKDPIYGHSHYLYAHKMGSQFNPELHHGNALGHLQWAGSEAPPHQGVRYPGEIEYVERAYGAERHRGLMTAMYHLAHQLDVGQTTVPVHSATRTPEGEEWSAKVGGPRPTMGDYAWRPPAGIHPFEKYTKRGRVKPKIDPSQGSLF